jgi:hypothetical protein
MLSFIVLLALLGFSTTRAARFTEDQRVAYWHARNNTWPPHWQPETEKFRRNMELREAELQLLPAQDERWENYMQFTAGRMVPRFTPTGFKIIQTPPEVQAMLKNALDDALLDWEAIPEEEQFDVLYTPLPSKFIEIPEVLAKVQKILHPLHEEWVGGIKLKPTSIYGIRANRNGSSLAMHVDQVHFCPKHCTRMPHTHYNSILSTLLDPHARDLVYHPHRSSVRQ